MVIRSKAWLFLIVTVAVACLSVVADAITISRFGSHLWEMSKSNTSTAHSTSLVQVASPVPTAVPSATPTPVRPLARQLEEALSVSSSTKRGEALFVVAQHAVVKGDYSVAIRAASATLFSSTQAESLTLVVECAIEDGLYDVAAEAAAKVRYTTPRDSLKLAVIEARRRATIDIKPLDVDRESMACLNSVSDG